MKRFFSFLVLAVFLTGCDDGDMEEVSFEFDESLASHCNVNSTGDNFFIYKTTDQRALILKIAKANFTNNVTTDSLDIGYIGLEIGLTNQLIYRTYNDNVTLATMCPTSGVPASYPVVTEERIAAGGNMFIRTTVIKSEENTEGATSITHYQHAISFSDVTFNTTDGNQRNESLPPVIYRTEGPKFVFDALSSLKTCGGNYKLIYKNNSNQAMMLKLNDADAAFLFSNDITAPKVRYLNAENELTHSFYSRTDITPLTDIYFCAASTPALPAITSTWKANDGVDNVSGIIEVVTEQIDDNAYKHTITLKNVTMARNSQNFRLRSNFVFGSIETTAP